MTVDYGTGPDPVAGAARSAAPSEVTRQTNLNDTLADIGSRLDTLEAGSGALVYRSTSQTITSSTGYTAASLDTEVYDDDGYWVIGSPTRLTVPAGVSRVRLTGAVKWSTGSTGRRGIKFQKNGASFVGECESLKPASSNFPHDTTTSHPVNVVEGDYFELMVSQNNGSDISATTLEFSIERVA